MGAREIRRQLLQNLKSNKRPRTTPQRDLGPKLLYLRLLAEVPYFGGAMFQATAEANIPVVVVFNHCISTVNSSV